MTYLIDTDWLIDYLRGRRNALELIDSLGPYRPAISIVTFAEVYEGIYFGSDPTYFEMSFLRYLDVADVIGITEDVARQWALLKGSLRQTGRLIPPQDLFIAATALHHDLVLVTRNLRHFERIPDLRILSGPDEAPH